MEKRVWRKECELCIFYITIFRGRTHTGVGESGKTGEEKGWKNERRNGRGGARCEVPRYAGTVWVFGL